ncbi:MAG: PHP domain-containing protein [Bacilli bacterium]|nr:PHP domain-containing protein [Bacilli bacterium]
MRYLYEEAEERENELMIACLDKIIKERFDKYKDRKNKVIDLHCHTVHSDGELTPIEILNLAIDNGISTLAITDHDNIDGVKRVRKDYSDFLNQSGLEFINGVELSVKVNHGRMHMLGYNIDIYNKELNDKLNEMKNNSMYSMISYFNDLRREKNISFSTEDILKVFNKSGNIGRPQIAKLLVKYGYVNSVQEGFDKYLIDMYERVRKLNKGINYKEAIELIKNAGGYAILAHPYSLEMNELELLKTIRELISCGLDGIEVYHSNHTKEQMKLYLEIAKKYNLLYSVGSDFHGKNVKPDIELGSGKNNNLNIKEVSLVRKIKNQ